MRLATDIRYADTTIPAGTEVVVEKDYGSTLDVTAYANDPDKSLDFWVFPSELKED